ncbi:MAG: RHS repeat-associated core domain-containing protein [Acidobacteria bacterium]|nr:RHS repeat-associated core domain-containing protein [Acidobacteriota bacterium]
MNRLKTAQSQANSPDPNCWGLQYGYDRYANLLSASITKCSGPALSLSVDNTTKITNSGFQYDAAGNVTNDGFSSFTWNAEGRMASTAGVTYTYDGDGQRVSKSNGKLYWYGINGQVLAESDANGNVTSEFIFFGNMRIARRDVPSGNVYYFLGDRLGNARVVTNSTGGVVEESDYYPFGVERPISDTLDNNYKFTSHERDTESGLDHTLYRQYASTQGRWLSPDHVRGKPTNPQSLNRYSYGGNNPCNAIDPDGGFSLKPEDYFLSPDWWRFAAQAAWNRGQVNARTYYDDNYNRLDKPDQWDRAWYRMDQVYNAVHAALFNNEDCRNMFNLSGEGLEPATLLESMMNFGSHGIIDIVAFADDPDLRNRVGSSATRASGNCEFAGPDNRVVCDHVDILIDVDYWNNPFVSNTDRARSLIHELGHVFELLKGAGGSQFITPDADDNAQASNRAAEEKCVAGLTF